MINNPWIALVVSLVLSLLWMRFVALLTKRGYVTSSTSRKLVHIGTGPLFLLTWLLFPDLPISRYFAALIPLLIVLQLSLVGLGLIKDTPSVNSMARTGNKKELLRGPLIYGVVFVLLTLFFWKSALAIIPLMILCGGDGLADLVGSRIKSANLPWAQRKTFAGSLAMFLGGIVFSLVILFLLRSIIVPPMKFGPVTLAVIVISVISTFVESITPSDWDNLTVPAVALVSTLLLV